MIASIPNPNTLTQIHGQFDLVVSNVNYFYPIRDVAVNSWRLELVIPVLRATVSVVLTYQ
jgi:hypothetical protein